MISYHLTKSAKANAFSYANGFKEADTNDIERIAKGITGYVWSPCVWRDGVRRQEHFLRADWCVLDFDSGEMTVADACNAFCDTIHLIGTTRSHGIDKGGHTCDRFRVAIKFTQSITNLRDYRYTMSKMVRRYPVDQQPKDGARFFFPCTEVIQSASEGYTEDPLEAHDSFERPNFARMEVYKRIGAIPPKARWALVNVMPIGERNTTWFWVAKELRYVGRSLDQIMSCIVNSATYAGKVSHDLASEIEQCVINGIKNAEAETDVIYGR